MCHCVDEFCAKFRLSTRERDILLLMTQNLIHSKDIAQHLQVSPNTANNHLKSIFLKVGVRSKSEILVRLLTETVHRRHEGHVAAHSS